MKVICAELSFHDYSGMIKYSYCYSQYDDWVYETRSGTL